MKTRLAAMVATAVALVMVAPVSAERLVGRIKGEEWSCSLTVNPLRGSTSTTRTGSNWTNGNRFNRNYNDRNRSYEPETTSKSVTRSLKWEAVIRIRGKERPEKLELKVDYVGRRGKDPNPFVMKSETRPVEVDNRGKAVLELQSPTATLTRTHSSSVSSGSSYSSGFRSIQSTVSGQQVDGCIIRLYANGQLVRRWMSNMGFEKLAETLK